MDNGKDFAEKSIFKGLEIVLEYERSLVKYFIAGNGAALVFILSFFRSSKIDNEAMQAFLCPMFAFGIGLVLSVAGFYLMYLFSRKTMELSVSMFQMRAIIKHENLSEQQITNHNNKINKIRDKQSKLAKKYRPIISIIQAIVALFFCYGLFSSLFNVSGFYV